ncbi:hypothetical protein SmJEL517_g04290 [Synchytrium microbalum]|uniref:Rab-GAP TBC domain-containing protein n=1 Tax=Synchytrium microbalum TaxID=1806994 RepID=A0A507BSN8_9FUNG|nr:uncharacterized protein SmJEL517_g04290 [Synchytrium microbalum]TPX32620.1 hypothetical protein SmJEL517_g04290 [Synchytrium microbalum]
MDAWRTAELEVLQAGALTGRVNQSRSLYWKIFLGFLPCRNVDAWPNLHSHERTQYDQLRSKYIFDPATAAQGARDWSLNNPLSLDEESPWKQYFEDVELQKVIRQDVERTFPDQAFFRAETVQNMMTDILFIWCKLNPDVSYRQGMHEILAPVLMVVHQDRLVEYDSDPIKLAVFSPVHVEHDSWVLFDRIMKSAKIWYDTGEDGDPRRVSSNSRMSSSKYSDRTSAQARKVIPVVAVCKRIQGDLLRATDFDLCFHLERVGVEPQLYGIRWLRLLFGREFPFSELLVLWDGIFADGPSLGLAEWICVALLVAARREVLGQDFSMVLHKLMRPPSSDNSNVSAVFFLNSARTLRTRYTQTRPVTTSNESPRRSSATTSNSNIPSSPSAIDSDVGNNNTGNLTPSQPKRRAGPAPWATPIQGTPNSINLKPPTLNGATPTAGTSTLTTPASSSSSLSETSKEASSDKSPKPPTAADTVINSTPIASNVAAGADTKPVEPPTSITARPNGFLADEARARERLAQLEREREVIEQRDSKLIWNLKEHVATLTSSLLGQSATPEVLDALQGLRSVIADLGGDPFAVNDPVSTDFVNRSVVETQHGDDSPKIPAKPVKYHTKTSTEEIVDAIDDFLSSADTPSTRSTSPSKSELRSSPSMPSNASPSMPYATSLNPDSLPPLAPSTIPIQPHDDTWASEKPLLGKMSTPNITADIPSGIEQDPWGSPQSNSNSPAVEAMMKGLSRMSPSRSTARNNHEDEDDDPNDVQRMFAMTREYPHTNRSSLVRTPSPTSKFFDSVLSTVSTAVSNGVSSATAGINALTQAVENSNMKARDPFGVGTVGGSETRRTLQPTERGPL